MITIEQAKKLEYRDIIYYLHDTNADGSAQRWMVNGKIQLWKTRPTEFRLPLKHGLYDYAYLSHWNCESFSLTEPKRR